MRPFHENPSPSSGSKTPFHVYLTHSIWINTLSVKGPVWRGILIHSSLEGVCMPIKKNILAQILVVLQREETAFWTMMDNEHEQSLHILYAQTTPWTWASLPWVMSINCYCERYASEDQIKAKSAMVLRIMTQLVWATDIRIPWRTAFQSDSCFYSLNNCLG